MSPEPRDHSFDELTRGLASGTLSRGKALRLMGAALVGGALASIPGIAGAKPKPAGAKCKHDHQCASGTCSSTGTCAAACVSDGGACTADGECCSRLCVEVREGVRVCAAAPPICDPPCPANCSCDFAADGTTTCIGCPPGLPCLISDAGDCGQCTMNGLVCVAGVQPGSVGCAPPCTVA